MKSILEEARGGGREEGGGGGARGDAVEEFTRGIRRSVMPLKNPPDSSSRGCACFTRFFSYLKKRGGGKR